MDTSLKSYQHKIYQGECTKNQTKKELPHKSDDQSIQLTPLAQKAKRTIKVKHLKHKFKKKITSIEKPYVLVSKTTLHWIQKNKTEKYVVV